MNSRTIMESVNIFNDNVAMNSTMMKKNSCEEYWDK